ncbi:hypothetical protein [Pseudonocardia acidicola]|uniref:Uncharacterized protein n=1 Tax=Pseudonocardia acidicola TaxID=2724939 RepID=A0ABX1SI01_9PSEU|nr:hypothetical protein [Pseudonocardia acidicola]NMH99889.1 hypothetical protein [Pseudonocardia acidicola]
MVDQSLNEQAREAIFRAIIKSAPTVGNSPSGIRDLAQAFALLAEPGPQRADGAGPGLRADARHPGRRDALSPRDSAQPGTA